MPLNPKRILSNPLCYHYLRQAMSGGLPFREWAEKYGLTNPSERIADLGCGPADILRYVDSTRKPAFYLGVDLSERYLDTARARTRRAGIDSQIMQFDLSRLASDTRNQKALLEILTRHRITRVLLLGVLHHIDDDAARRTLQLVHEAPSVRSLVTQDVAILPGWTINNWFSSRDRGEFIRTEAAYDALAGSAGWRRWDKSWTSPGLKLLRYIHYQFEK